MKIFPVPLPPATNTTYMKKDIYYYRTIQTLQFGDVELSNEINVYISDVAIASIHITQKEDFIKSYANFLRTQAKKTAKIIDLSKRLELIDYLINLKKF